MRNECGKKDSLSPEMRFAEWAAYWMETTKDFRVVTTDAKYEEILNSILIPILGEQRLSEITEDTILECLVNEKAKGRSNSRIISIFSVLTVLLTGAVNHNLIERNPCLTVKLPHRVRQECAILTDADIQKMMNIYGTHRYMPMIMTMLFLGLRVGEAIGLDWTRVDLKARTVTIDCQMVSFYSEGRTQTKLVPYTKNRVKRTLPLCDQAYQCLSDLKAEQVLLNGEAAEQLSGPVFREADGNYVKYAAFYYEFNKLMAAIGREDVHPHSLRHTAASTLLYTTGDLLLVKEFLGHRSIRSSEVYPEATEKEKQETADAIDHYYGFWLRWLFEEAESEIKT